MLNTLHRLDSQLFFLKGHTMQAFPFAVCKQTIQGCSKQLWRKIVDCYVSFPGHQIRMLWFSKPLTIMSGFRGEPNEMLIIYYFPHIDFTWAGAHYVNGWYKDIYWPILWFFFLLCKRTNPSEKDKQSPLALSVHLLTSTCSTENHKERVVVWYYIRDSADADPATQLYDCREGVFFCMRVYHLFCFFSGKSCIITLRCFNNLSMAVFLSGMLDLHIVSSTWLENCTE